MYSRKTFYFNFEDSFEEFQVVLMVSIFVGNPVVNIYRMTGGILTCSNLRVSSEVAITETKLAKTNA